MPAPFYNNIKGTTAGAPGTGAFTPNAAAPGARPWSYAPTGWIGLVRYEDTGGAWETCLSYWNGTTLSRAATQIPHNPDGTLQTSTGSQLSLTSAATAEMAADASEVMSHVGTTQWRYVFLQPNTNNTSALGFAALTKTGTATAVGMTATNLLTGQCREQLASATTANAQAGWAYATSMAIYSTTAGLGGAEFVGRFGASQLPTSPRLFAGLTTTTFVGVTTEISALVASYAGFALDSTDANIQLLVNSNAGGGTKTDTGIPWAANGLYETTVWWEPGGGRIYGLLIRLDTGAIWTGSTTTDIPANGALMFPQMMCGLNGTNTGTALNFNPCSISVRNGV